MGCRRFLSPEGPIRFLKAAPLLTVIGLIGYGPISDESQPAVQTTTPTSSASSTTTAPAPVDSLTTYAPPLPVADGSGCSPRDDLPLPAGDWFGYIIDADEATLTFDLACRFTGRQAELAAAADGQAVPADGVYVRNESDSLRVLDIVPGIRVDQLDPFGEPVEGELFFPQWLDSGTIIRGQPVFVRTNNEQIKSILDLVDG